MSECTARSTYDSTPSAAFLKVVTESCLKESSTLGLVFHANDLGCRSVIGELSGVVHRAAAQDHEQKLAHVDYLTIQHFSLHSDGKNTDIWFPTGSHAYRYRIPSSILQSMCPVKFSLGVK